IEAGNMRVSVSRGDLGSFITDHARGFEAQTTLKGVDLDVENDLRGEYDFDADKWQKILFNLLSNAIKFTPEGGRVAISLKAGRHAGHGAGHHAGRPAVEVRVSDTGIGIPPDKLPFIFNRFYQVDDSPTRNHGGTGIGLALVKELVELMDGAIDVESRPGAGTMFRVLVPVEMAGAGEALRDVASVSAARDSPE